MTSPRAIWLVRHAPAAVSGICYGRSEVPVTLVPHAAATRLAEAWQRLQPGVRPELWTSPLRRCRLVAEALGELWGARVQVDARLAEISFGDWEGKPFAELERDDRERFTRWMARYDELAPPGGETVSELMARVGDWLSERRSDPRADGPVLAVCHAGVIRSARAIELDLPYRAFVAEPAPHLELELLNARRRHVVSDPLSS